MENIIKHYLKKLGLKDDLKGFEYTASVIEFGINHSDEYVSLSDIYEEITNRYEINKQLIESVIRYSLQKANIKETNKEFIFKAIISIKSIVTNTKIEDFIIFNKAFIEKFITEVIDSRSNNTALSLVVFYLDSFCKPKKLPHDLAALIQKSIRDIDLFHFDNNFYYVILKTDFENALHVANRVKFQIKRHNAISGNIPISCSVAEYANDDIYTFLNNIYMKLSEAKKIEYAISY